MSYKEYASKEFVDELYFRKSDINTTIRDFLVLKDISTGFLYNVYVEDGKLSMSCKVLGIKVSKMPEKLTYMQGEKFDAVGLEVIAVLGNGESIVINEFTVDEYVTNHAVNIFYIDMLGNKFNTSIDVEMTEFDPAVVLIDFEYTANDDGTYTLTGWKQTLNGEASTEMIIPDNNMIVL